MVEITKEFLFEAAHHLPPVGPDHKCFRLHGHLFRIEVTVAGEVDPLMGWVMDFGELARVGREVVSRMDHQVLNDFPEIGVPTSENLARYLFHEMAARIPGVVAITVHESPTSRCTYRPGAATPMRDIVEVSVGGGEALTVSAAHFLVLPPDDREPIHGHDYGCTASAWVAPGHQGEASKGLLAALRRGVMDLDHRLLLPDRPAVGTLTVGADTVTLDLPRERLVLPARDCVLLPCANTATEAIAQVIAERIARTDEVHACAATRIEVRLTEAGASTARAWVDLTRT